MHTKYSTATERGTACPLPEPPSARTQHSSRDKYRRLYFPYCFKAIDEPARIYLPLNRHYKPLGLNGGWVDYRDFRENFIRFVRNPHEINVWFNSFGRGDSRGLYLYFDDPESRKDYGERYARLLQHVDADWRESELAYYPGIGQAGTIHAAAAATVWA